MVSFARKIRNQIMDCFKTGTGLRNWTVLAALCWLTLTPPARSLTFNITYDSSVTSQTNAAQIETAFGIATQTIQTLFTNNSTVNITVYWGATGPFSGGIGLGESSFTANYFTYAQITNALRATLEHAADNDTTTHVLILRRMLARAVRREQRIRKEFFG